MHNLMELELLPEEPVITVTHQVCKWTCSFTALAHLLLFKNNWLKLRIVDY